MRRVGAGDRAAAARLYDAYGARVHRLAYLTIRDAGTAEDIVQETFLRLWRHAPRWRAGTPVLPWLLRVASNLCTDHIRKHRRMRVETPPELACEGAEGYRAMREQEIARHVHAAIAALPHRQRTALLLTWQDHMSNAEAGRVLKISEQAMDSLLARARRNLRSHLAAIKPDLIGD